MPFDATPNTTADVLRRARALIDTPEKWCKGALVRDGAFCVRGALKTAISGSIWAAFDPLLTRAEQALGFPGFDGVHSEPRLPSWNNAPERTHADVMAAFDKAIALAEAR